MTSLLTYLIVINQALREIKYPLGSTFQDPAGSAFRGFGSEPMLNGETGVLGDVMGLDRLDPPGTERIAHTARERLALAGAPGPAMAGVELKAHEAAGIRQVPAMSGVELQAREATGHRQAAGQKQATGQAQSYDDMAAAVANILGVPYGSGATGVGNAYETDTQDQILRENYLPVIEEDYPVVCTCNDLGRCDMDNRIRRCVSDFDFAAPLSALAVSLALVW